MSSSAIAGSPKHFSCELASYYPRKETAHWENLFQNNDHSCGGGERGPHMFTLEVLHEAIWDFPQTLPIALWFYRIRSSHSVSQCGQHYMHASDPQNLSNAV